MEKSYSQTWRVVRTNLRKDGRWKKPQRQTKITMYGTDLRRSRTYFGYEIENEDREAGQRNRKIVANQSID